MEPPNIALTEPAREFAGLSVWQPHTKVQTQKAETGFESRWTLLWWLAPTHPPLSVHLCLSTFGVFLPRCSNILTLLLRTCT